MLHALRIALLPLALSACTSTPTPAVPPDEMAQFVQDMQTVLSQQFATHNYGGLVGAVELKITLNRQNQPTACSALPGRRELVEELPAGATTSNALDLVQAAEIQCWQTLYPTVPAALFEPDGTVEIIAPLILMPRALPVVR